MRSTSILGAGARAAIGLVCVLLGPWSCVRSSREGSAALASRIEPASSAVRWPGALLAGEHEGPTLFRGSARGSRGYAYVAPGAAVRPRGGVRHGRVQVRIDGGLQVRGWMDVDALEGVVLARGRVAGTPVYVVPGDRVRFVSAEGDVAEVEASAYLGHPTHARSPLFRGRFPLDRIGADVAGEGTGPTPGRPARLTSAAVLRSSPDGEVIWSMPSFDPPLPITVLREEGRYAGVRIGSGPYLVGFVEQGALDEGGPRKQDLEVLDPWSSRRVPEDPGVRNPWAEREAPRGDDDATDDDATDDDTTEDAGSDEPPVVVDERVPARLRDAVVRPVHRVRAGARVRVDGATVAVFREDGVAVELDRDGDLVLVLAGVDDTVAVRGEMVASDLSTLEP